MTVSFLGVATIFAGSGTPVTQDGNGVKASFNSPVGITINQKTGEIYVSDHHGHAIRKITPQGKHFSSYNTLLFISISGHVSTVAGCSQNFFADGEAKNARFNFPAGICFSESENSLYIADSENHRIRKLDLTESKLFFSHFHFIDLTIYFQI